MSVGINDKTLRELVDIHRCLRGLRDTPVVPGRDSADGMRDWWEKNTGIIANRLKAIIDAERLVEKLFKDK